MDLFGYSVGGGTYCLIYGYMARGSLEDRLCCEVKRWKMLLFTYLGVIVVNDIIPPGFVCIHFDGQT